MDLVKCIRCGVCCIVAPCGIAPLNSEGICSFLTIHEDGYTSCKYIEEHGNQFGNGCFLRSPGNEEIYKYYKDQAERMVGVKLNGIKTSDDLLTTC